MIPVEARLGVTPGKEELLATNKGKGEFRATKMVDFLVTKKEKMELMDPKRKNYWTVA